MDDILDSLRDKSPKAEMDEDSKKKLQEVKKVLRDVRSVTPLDFDNASAQEVYDNIMIGNRLAALDTNFLVKHKVSHLLNCAAPGPNCFMSVSPDLSTLSQHNMSYLGLQLSDDSEEDISKKFIESGQWIDKALAEGGKVLVNCWAGISRSSTIVLAFLMRHRGMQLTRAVRQVKSARNIQPNPGFLRQLVDLEQTLNKERAGNKPNL